MNDKNNSYQKWYREVLAPYLRDHRWVHVKLSPRPRKTMEDLMAWLHECERGST